MEERYLKVRENEKGEKIVMAKNFTNHACEPLIMKVFERFYFFAYMNDQKGKVLVVFSDKDKTLCYDCSYRNARNVQAWGCKGCYRIKRVVTKVQFHRDDDDKEYITFHRDHVCQPRPYLSENYIIID